MKKILLVGEHPFSMTGNGNMMSAILTQIDFQKFKIACFVAHEVSPAVIDIFTPLPFKIIPAKNGNDEWGQEKLLEILEKTELDAVVLIGIDIWRYALIWNRLIQIRDRKKFRLAAIFPYDLRTIRDDWIYFIKSLDLPYVYSQYGFRKLRKVLPQIRYFRPPLNNCDLFQPLIGLKPEIRSQHFPTLNQKTLLFGFIGQNQFRKEPQKLVKAFLEAKKKNPNIALYLHTELQDGVYNLQQYAADCGAGPNDILAKRPGIKVPPHEMARIYNALDCLINCSMQEGLSWTVIEAMLCGIPVIASDTTAHIELVKGVGQLVPCNEVTYLPLFTASGTAFVESRGCRVEDISEAILTVSVSARLRKKMSERGLKKAQDWLEGVSDFNETLDEILKPKPKQKKIERVLFVQHSSAGDVLMSTQCFKGIKERHPDLELDYMTQEQYIDIIKENPYISKILPWDPELIKQYAVVYNPHGEKILPGGWNNLDVKLADLYPYFCRVQPDKMFIKQIKPRRVKLPEEYIVVHTTGGQPEYRTYRHMDFALKGLEIPKVQIGGADDLLSQTVDLDLRGKLSFRESAWVMARAKAAVVVDSFVSHLAGALGTPAVVIFGPAPARVVGPKGDPKKLIFLEPNKLEVCPILSNCWGKPGKNKCLSPCINSISPILVRKALLSLIGKEYERDSN